MTKRTTDKGSLPRVLRQEILRRLESRVGDDAALRRRLDARLKTVLGSGELVGAEAAIVREDEGPVDGERLDRLLSMRVQRAIDEALEVLDEQGEAPAMPRPRVVHASDPKRATAYLETLRSTLAVELEETREDALVLTDEVTYQSLREQLGDASHVRFRARGAQEPADDAPAHVEVIDVQTGLDEMARTVLRAKPAPASSGGAPVDDEDLVGQVLGGKYRVVRRKGHGGFGTVYEAVDAMLGATVAVKVLNQKAARSRTALSEFLDEAKRLTNLDHENIVRWITFDKTREGLHYFVMEYLSGEELDKILTEQGRLEPQRVAELLLQTLAALRAAHHRKDGESLLHLDLKPQNVFVQPGEPEKVKVIDFGIGQHVGAEAIAAQSEEGSGGLIEDDPEASLDLTLEQSLVTAESPSSVPARSPGGTAIKRARGGTIIYSSPEQCAHLAGHKDIVALDGRSDLYSLGVMGFKMLTGRYPFDRWDGLKQGFANHLERAPHKVGSMGVKVPRKLAAFIDRSLEKDRDERWADTDEAWRAMHAIVHPPTWPRLVAVLAPVLLAVVGILWWLQPAETLPPVDMRLAGGRVGRVSANPLYVSSESPSVEIDPGFARAIQGGHLTLLDYGLDGSSAGAAAVAPGWTASWSDSGTVILERSRFDATWRGRVQLGAVAGDGTNQQSLPFDVVSLGADAWSIKSFDVADHDDRQVALRGHLLELVVSAEADDLERVVVGSLPLLPDSASSEGGLLTYAVRIEDLELASGAVELGAELTDKSGAVRRETLRFEAVESRLVCSEGPVLEGATLLGDVYVLTRESEARLELASSRPARVVAVIHSQRRGTVQVPVSEVSDTHVLALDLAAGADDSGRIEIGLDERDLVHHAADEDAFHPIAELRYEYRHASPSFQIGFPSGVQAGTSGRQHFGDGTDPTLVLARDGLVVPVQIAGVVTSLEDGRSQPLEPVPWRGRQALEVDLPLAVDGVYEVALTAALLDPASGEALGRTQHEPFEIVVDRRAPALRFADDGLLAIVDDKEQTVELSLEADAQDTPVTLSWQIDPGGSWREVAAPLDTGESSIALPRISTLVGRDGEYELQMRVEDAAGNVSQLIRRPLHCSLEGPEVTVGLPRRDSTDWKPDATGRWAVEAIGEDPNGCLSMEATLVARDVPDKSLDIALERHGEGGETTDWRGALELDYTWSGLEVALEFRARDGLGRESTLKHQPMTLAGIAREKPARIQVVADGRPAKPMARVALDGEDYEFHGRTEALERDEYRDWQLDYGGGSSSWAVFLRAGELQEVYLDEQETTEAEFLAFLQAPDGWSEARHWAQSPGTVSRRMELEARLESSPDAGRLPMADVTWDEALAYAHWMGKRLPTAVEWEYAVRGGEAYRPFASFSGRGPLPTGDDVNYDADLSYGGAAWAVDRGVDVCTRTGLQNLCSNVSEWTASPSAFVAAGETPPPNKARHFSDRTADLVQPWAWWDKVDAFLVAGGSYRSPGMDYRELASNPRDTTSPAVGFRCALSVADYFEAKEGRSQVDVADLEPR